MRAAFQLGDFVEDTVGHQLLSAVKEHGFAAHAAYGTYLWDDGQKEVHVRRKIVILSRFACCPSR